MNWTREPLPEEPANPTPAYFFRHAIGRRVVFISDDGTAVGLPVLVVDQEQHQRSYGMFYGIEDDNNVVETFFLVNGLDASQLPHWRIVT